MRHKLLNSFSLLALLAGLGVAAAPFAAMAQSLDLGGANQTLLSGFGSYTSVTNSGASAVLTVDTSLGNTNFAGAIADGVGLVGLIKTGVGTLALTGVNTQSGDTGFTYPDNNPISGYFGNVSLAVTGGTLAINSGAALGNGVVAINNATLASIGGSSITIGNTVAIGVTSGANATFDTTGGDIHVTSSIMGFHSEGSDYASDNGLIKTGTGTLYLPVDNSFIGGVQIQGGTVAINAIGGLGETPVAFSGPGGPPGFPGPIGPIGAASQVTISAGATLRTMADINGGWGAAVTLDASSCSSRSCFANIAPDSGMKLVIDSDVAGAAGLNMNGQGTLFLTGPKSYTGGTQISSGTLQIDDATATNAGSFGISNGGRLQLMADALSLSPKSFTLAGQGIIDTNGYNAAIGTAIADAGDSGGSLVKDGAGILTLSAAATYSGATEVRAGTLSLGLDDALSSRTSVQVDSLATLDLGGHSLAIAGLAGSGTVSGSASSGGGSLEVGSGGSSSAFSGLLTDGSGQLTLTKVGADTLTLTGANTYTGGTNLNAGEIVAGNGAALGTGAVAMTNGTVLGFSTSMSLANALAFTGSAGGTLDTGANAVTLAGTVSGAGALTKVGAGTLTLTEANSYTGGTYVDAGTLAVANAQSLGSGALYLADKTTLGFLSSMILANSIRFSGAGDPTIDTGASAVTLAGAISGPGSLTKLGNGTLTLTGADAYTGATLVSQGTLEVDGSIVSATTIGNGAMLSGVGAVGAISVSSGGVLSPGNAAQPYGTLHATGNVAFTQGSTYAVTFGSTGSSLLTTTGSASLAGTVAATWTGVATSVGSRYTILTANGGVSGTFGALTVSGLTTNLPVLAYDATDVYLVFNGLTNAAVASSFDTLAVNRLGALVTNGVLASVLDGVNEQINCDNCVSAFGSVGSLSAGLHGRLTLNDNFALVGGVAYSQYHSGGVDVASSPIFLGALRYDKAEWGAARPFAEIGVSASPWQRTSFDRYYNDAGVSRNGTGSANAATYSVFGKLGWIYRWSPIDEAAAWGGLSRSWQSVGNYVEGGANNPSPATVANGTDLLNVVRIGAQWTHLFGPSIETQISLAAAQTFDAQSGLSGSVLGDAGVRPATQEYRWAEYGLRVGYRFSQNMVVDVFANGTLGGQPAGDTIHGGAGLRWAF